MSQRRYARLDVEFRFKRTANKLLDEFGPYGPLVFVYLILAAKDGSPPGSFSYPNEAIGWQKLGLDGREIPFTLEEFFTVTGRLKQTSRRRNGRVTDTLLTRYGDWQKDSRRYEEATRKARKRRENTADTQRTAHGTPSGRKGGPRTRTRTTPQPPNGKNGKPIVCGHNGCPITLPTEARRIQHLETVHGILPAEALA